ncbi:MAG: hypothetical protein EA411_03220 [Saprospirales bacterium]|nr:MAG: hypothetical protein EA411_03220 [Saprospirales bacterium]
MLKTLLLSFSFFIFFGQTAKGQELSLYIVPSPVEINWESPSKLMRTSLVNQFANSPGPVDYPLGHIYVGLHCSESGVDILTGMTRDHRNSAFSKTFREGYGMGILFADIEGRLQNTEEVRTSVDALMEAEAMSFLSFEVSEEVFERLVYYYENYRESGFCSIYNGLNRPREGLGAGCAKFAISFLKVAEIDFSPWRSEWIEFVKVPERLIGGMGINNRHVSILRLLLSANWAKEGEKYVPFEVYEPWNIHQWVLAQHEKPDGKIGIIEKSGNPGVIMDFTNSDPPQTPVFILEAD